VEVGASRDDVTVHFAELPVADEVVDERASAVTDQCEQRNSV